MAKPLDGRKIAVVVDSLYIPEEIETYQRRFHEMGATVDIMSDLWGQPGTTFVCDIDGIDQKRQPNKPLQTLYVHIDFKLQDPTSYDAVLMAANYCAVRLRYFQPPSGMPIDASMTKTAPAVEFFAKAMKDQCVVKGMLCHGLWILTPRPDLLQDRRVICHEVVLADVTNAGAIYQPSPNGVVVDNDLVTGRSIHEVDAYVDAITDRILKLCPKRNRETVTV
jgi:protease I